MKISYNLINQVYSYEQKDRAEIEKVNFVLSNSKGDFLNLGTNENFCKYQGLCVLDTKSLEVFKFLDAISLQGLSVSAVEYGGYYASRKYVSKYTLGDEENPIQTQDRFYLGPRGGCVYEISNYEGNLNIDLDLRKLNDFDEWGRDYKVYEKNGVVFVEYQKSNPDGEDYNLYFGVKAMNFTYDLFKDFVKKEYDYSKSRSNTYVRYVYRLMSVKINNSKRLIFGAGFCEKEVVDQINLLEKHQVESESLDKEIFETFLEENKYEKPITQDAQVAYKLSKNAIHRFLNKNLAKPSFNSGSYAGFLWFSNMWTRDELVGIRAFINSAEEEFVKEKLYDYLDLIDEELGTLKRIEMEGSLSSPDGVFWLAKRFEDFIFYCDKNKRLKEIFSQRELKLIYKKFHLAFRKISQNYWDKENELLKVNYGDSWMDTIEVRYPLDIQVQFLGLVSFIVVLGQVLGLNGELDDMKDFESALRKKIRNTYFDGEYLYNDIDSKQITCNVFLSYYFHPDLFELDVWETIFDNTLNHLQTSWGGISSLSKKDKEFVENYSGENNLSYHRGDVWYWINNIAAIAMHDLNEKKYRPQISKILMSSTKDILSFGSIGFGSEVSSASSQKAEGNLAQLWSSSTYIEMIDKIFGRINN